VTSIDDVQDLSPRDQYVAASMQTAFDYTFPIFLDEDLVVDIDGEVQVLTTDYTVTGKGNDTGGTVTLIRAIGDELVGGEIVTIYRDIAIARDTDVQQNGPWSSVNYNDEMDKVFLIMQELKNKVGRAIRFPITSASTNAQAEMNPISGFFGKFLRITSAGILEAATALDNVVALSAEVIGELLNPQTVGELAASITPVAYRYEAGVVDRYGNNGTPGTTDMTSAVQAAFDSGHGVKYLSGYTYLQRGEVTVTASNIKVEAYGATIIGHTDNAANPMFDFVRNSGSTSIKNVHWYGGSIDPQGALGWIRMRNCLYCSVEDFICETTVAVANSFGIHYINGFNFYVKKFNMHGSQGITGLGNAGLASGIKIESDGGNGFTVINNISISDGIVQRCDKDIDLVFATASSGVHLENVALLDTQSAPLGTNGIYLTGVLDNLSIVNCKSEYLPTCVNVDNGTNPDRAKITVADFRFTMKAGQYAFNIEGSTVTLVLTNIDAFSTGASAAWFNNHQGKTVCTNIPVGISNITAWDGTDGAFYNHEQEIIPKTSAFSIKRIQENVIWTNAGAGAAATFTLPIAAAQENFRATFRVMAAQALRVDPDGTDQIIGLTDAGGDRISSSTIGDTIALVSDGVTSWFVDKSYGTWADIN